MSETQPTSTPTDTATPTPAEALKRFASPRQKVPPFARYKGTSAWRSNKRRVREHAAYQAAAALAAAAV